MPIYEYQCQACHHEFEKLQKISDAPLVECPQCHQPELKKKISAAGFRLSGGGWYETDFKSGNKKNIAGDNKESAKAENSGEKKTEAPAPAASPKAESNSKAETASKATKASDH